ncbi:MAG: hypothetical protein L0Y71_05640 [Gemmataceae bacterium]|nr:hypothetical protein [Gemmataceae bacterium]
MRRKAIVSGLAVLALAVLMFSPAWGQFPGGRKGGFGGGGMPFGGGGQFGGGGGRSPFGGGGSDPNRIFDMLARGRPYFLVTETQRLRDPLTQYLRERGITNGQVTRELFAQYNEQQMKALSGGTARPGGFSTPGGFMVPGGFQAPGNLMAIPSASGPGGDRDRDRDRRGSGSYSSMTRWADDEFNRRDANGDDVLNTDEMPDAIKNDLVRWDANHDNLIDRDEHRGYFVARLQNGDGRGGLANPVTIIIQEEFDSRPTVLRAGKLPKELKWFEQLDTDGDGQVAMFEWRKAGKSMDDYATLDRNEDGFITPEEALRTTMAYNQARDDNGEGNRDRDRDRRPGNSLMGRNGDNGGGPFAGPGGGFGGGFGGGNNQFNSEEFRAKMQDMRSKFGGGKGGPFGGGFQFGGKKGKKGG